MTNADLIASFINANQTAYFTFYTSLAKTLVKDLRNADVDMYYLNQAEKYAAELNKIANDQDTFDVDYFNTRVVKGVNQFKGWVNNENTENDVRTACQSFLAYIN